MFHSFSKADIMFPWVIFALIVAFTIFGVYFLAHWFFADFNIRQTWICK